MSDWNGQERRAQPTCETTHDRLMRDLRGWLEERDAKLHERIDELQERQYQIRHQLEIWESNAGVVKVLVVTFVSIIAAAGAVYEWLQSHLK